MATPYLTPKARASVGTQRYLGGFTDAQRLLVREEILSATPKKLSDYAEKIKSAGSAVCIIAPAEKLPASELDAVLDV